MRDQIEKSWTIVAEELQRQLEELVKIKNERKPIGKTTAQMKFTAISLA